jgi:hypothetical protein
MADIDRFEELIIDALSNVSQSYYSTVYENIVSFKAALNGKQGQFDDTSFERYGERVFCYEFYHQLRLLIDFERTKNSSFLNGTLLQGEVKKWQISGLLDRFGLDELSKEFVPDFLMHSPGDATSHPYVIEVKCIANLSPDALLYDLEKLNEFITSYHYKRGLFISVNSHYEYLMDIISSLSRNIDRMKSRSNIKVFCKHAQDSEIEIYQL